MKNIDVHAIAANDVHAKGDLLNPLLHTEDALDGAGEDDGARRIAASQLPNNDAPVLCDQQYLLCSVSLAACAQAVLLLTLHIALQRRHGRRACWLAWRRRPGKVARDRCGGAVGSAT